MMIIKMILHHHHQWLQHPISCISLSSSPSSLLERHRKRSIKLFSLRILNPLFACLWSLIPLTFLLEKRKRKEHHRDLWCFLMIRWKHNSFLEIKVSFQWFASIDVLSKKEEENGMKKGKSHRETRKKEREGNPFKNPLVLPFTSFLDLFSPTDKIQTLPSSFPCYSSGVSWGFISFLFFLSWFHVTLVFCSRPSLYVWLHAFFSSFFFSASYFLFWFWEEDFYVPNTNLFYISIISLAFRHPLSSVSLLHCFSFCIILFQVFNFDSSTEGLSLFFRLCLERDFLSSLISSLVLLLLPLCFSSSWLHFVLSSFSSSVYLPSLISHLIPFDFWS